MRDEQEALLPVLPLYLGELLLLLTAMAAVNIALDDPPFAQLATVASVLAVGIGLAMRLGGINREYLLYAALAFCALALLSPTVRFELVSALVPAPAIHQAENAIAVVMLWLAIASAAGATTNAATTFVAVPVTTAFAMVAQSNIGDQFFALLLVFALLGLFQVSYEHMLEQSAQQRTGQRGVLPGQAVRAALLFASLFCSVAFVAASLGAQSATMVSQGALRQAVRSLTHSATASRPRPSLEAPVYYPQGEGLTLGEPLASLSNQPVMIVEADKPALWRGAAYDHYTGSRWTASLESATAGRSYGQWANVPQPPEEVPRRGGALRQRIRILEMRSNALFAAAVPVRVRGEFSSFQVTRYGNITTNERIWQTWAGMRYEVESLLPNAAPALLRQAGADYPEAIRASYLQMPNSAWPLREVALTVAGQATNPYDQVVALERFLEQEFTYTLKPPRPPRGADRTVWFVSESRLGCCDLFASALALMSRSLGVPARLATGFASGTADRAGQYHVLARDAHAWAEVYFPGSGWVAFDPLPLRVATGAEAGAARKTSILVRWLRGHLSITGPRLVLLVTFLLAALLLFQPTLRTLGADVSRRLFGPPLCPAERIARAYAGAERSLRKAGLPRLCHETPREHLGKVAAARETVGEQALIPLRHIATLFERSCYARPMPSPADAERARSALADLRHALRRRARH